MKLGKYRPGHKIENAEAIETLLESWPIPDVKDERRNLTGRSTAMGMSLDQLYQKQHKQEVEEPEEEFTPLSIQEIEQIREEAYQEGHAEGKEAGYQEGFDQGKLEGAQKGYEEGLEQGKQEGLELAKPEVAEKIAQLTQLLDELATPFEQVSNEVEKQIVMLATELAKAVVHGELTVNDKAIFNAMKVATDALKNQHHALEILLNPEDYELVQQAIPAEQLVDRNWKLVVEPSITKGGLHINSDNSSIDYSVELRLKEILESFLQEAGIDSQNHDS
ncbi:flagellar assembly protein FliH [Pseudoalteromonas sp. SSM20]|uniref:flagellar assembly protein FliH n=1 Tax=Pseudoalteromonas sp. SSM20 TaxID=3139394 RepID=UPI003BAA54CD